MPIELMGLFTGRGIGRQSFSYIPRDSNKNPSGKDLSGKGTEPNGTKLLRAVPNGTQFINECCT